MGVSGTLGKCAAKFLGAGGFLPLNIFQLNRAVRLDFLISVIVNNIMIVSHAKFGQVHLFFGQVNYTEYLPDWASQS